MLFSEVIARSPSVRSVTSADAPVTGAQYDSRRVGPGDMFVAMRGESTDGNAYVAQALLQGAAAIVTDSPAKAEELRATRPALPVAVTGSGRRALAEASSAVFGRPQDNLKVSAVTGTNGKTTTAFLLEQLLSRAGRKCLLIGTIETRIAGRVLPSEHTTPESRDLLALFAEAVDAGCTEVVMEMSSHALAQERVWGIAVDVAIFTNLTQDHLDFHRSMEKYAAAKARLFEGVGTRAPRVAVINADDAFAPALMCGAARCEERHRYTMEARAAEFAALDVVYGAAGTRYTLHAPGGTIGVRSQLTGRVNVYNQMAACAAALARGVAFDDVMAALPELRAVPGRFETVANRLGITVVVDYAHTDDALRNLIAIARELAGAANVITMFGCGGDRDTTKRPKMGRVAGEGSDWVVLTSDNPRSENPLRILGEILPGVQATDARFVVEPDRRVAIETAIRLAKRGDIVLLAGKGHEKTQTFADHVVAFDDAAVAADVLLEIQTGEVKA